MRHKTELFAKETNTRKTLITTMISVEGLKRNEYSNVIYVELTGEDLF